MISGEDIRKKRKQLGLSAHELASLLKVKVDNLYKWEKGTKPTDPEDYRKVENWLIGKLENVPQETIHQESPATYNRALETLTISNQMLIENNTKMVDTHTQIMSAILQKLGLLDTIQPNFDKIEDNMGLMTDLALKSYEAMTVKLMEEISDLRKGLSTVKPAVSKKPSSSRKH